VSVERVRTATSAVPICLSTSAPTCHNTVSQTRGPKHEPLPPWQPPVLSCLQLTMRPAVGWNSELHSSGQRVKPIICFPPSSAEIKNAWRYLHVFYTPVLYKTVTLYFILSIQNTCVKCIQIFPNSAPVDHQNLS